MSAIRIKAQVTYLSCSVIAVVLLVLAGLILNTLHYYEEKQREVVLHTSEQLVVQSYARQLRKHLKEIDADLRILANINVTRSFCAFPSDANRNAIGLHYLLFTSNKKRYDQIRLLDNHGYEILRVDQDGIIPKEQLQDKSQRYYFIEAQKLQKDEVYISPLDLNIEHGAIEVPYKPMMRFITPVTTAEGVRLGYAIFNYLAQELIDDVIQMGKVGIGDPLFLNKKGYWLHSNNARQNWGFMFPERRNINFANTLPQLWSKMQNKKSDQLLHNGSLYTFSMSGNWVIGLDIDALTYLKQTQINHIPLIVAFTIMCFFLAVGAWTIASMINKRRMINYRRERGIAKLKTALKEVKTLGELLPICSSCRKVRNDQGYWQQIEEYIAAHSDTEFSHSLCEPCMRKLYPKLKFDGDTSNQTDDNSIT